mgnify:CR=1 FL=1
MGLSTVGGLGDLENQIKALKDVINTKFDDTILTLEETSWTVIRKKRDYLLWTTDWTMTPGCTVDQAAWAAYRQVLRDIPQTYLSSGFSSVVWPEKPSTSGPNTE